MKIHIRKLLIRSAAIIVVSIALAIIIIGYNVNDHHFHGLTKSTDIIKTLESETPEIFEDFPEGNEYFSVDVINDREITFSDIGSKVVFPVKFKCDVDGLKEYLYEYNTSYAKKNQNAYIDVSKKTVIEAVQGTEVDIDKLVADLNSIKCGMKITDYYIPVEVTTEELQAKMDEYKDFESWEISYDNGIAVTLPEDKLSIDETGNISVDTSFIDSFVTDTLDGAYTTVGGDHSFKTHDGKEITVSGGTFGNELNIEAETEVLKRACEQHLSQINRIPLFSHEDGDKVGDSYVEVSIDEQHAYVYIDGELVLDSDVVTGCVSKKNDTPKGTWYMYDHAVNRMLYPQGATTGSHVDRWMPFTPDGCGLHDASWRGRFGGTIYKTNGSHGCVNCPKKFAYDLFDVAYVGLPVVVY